MHLGKNLDVQAHDQAYAFLACAGAGEGRYSCEDKLLLQGMSLYLFEL